MKLAEKFGDSEPAFRRPAPSIWRGYEHSQSTTKVEASMVGSCFDRVPIILRRVSGSPLGLHSTLQLTKALRDTLMSACPVQPVPEWISGHSASGQPSAQDHLGFFPLPHVGRAHADGHLLGLALAVPGNISSEEQARCWRGVLYDENGFAKPLPQLRLGALGIWDLELAEGDAQPVSLQPEKWTAADSGGAVRWATVTPITFDKHPSGANQEQQIEQTIAQACLRIGLPQPSDIILSHVSMFEGAPHSRAFPCIQRKSGGNIHHIHAILTFSERVCGPMLLGAGRYRGYGLCRPLEQGESES